MLFGKNLLCSFITMKLNHFSNLKVAVRMMQGRQERFIQERRLLFEVFSISLREIDYRSPPPFVSGDEEFHGMNLFPRLGYEGNSKIPFHQKVRHEYLNLSAKC
ncbi:hypothetical protein CEXT_800261 [Caerostris extrusa]|uniref:Uncharacterized protein n=1 Tax=Caerostris extrusa TaxID=172846 RepID=A0AAV4XND5_CAEEX|nr:hypothetical protein CEXT_800261 [Caerostris extrusa]